MSRGSWTMYTWSSGDTWVEDGTLAPPNRSLNLGITSTKSKIQLADGDFAYTTPSTKYNYEVINFTWLSDDGTIKTKIDNYVKNQDKVKIVASDGTNYIGFFVSVNDSWLVGRDSDTYDITAGFENLNRT